MLSTLAIAHYRSIHQLVVPLGRLNVITGANGSGKSNLYKALRLLAATASGGVVNALAEEGGLESTFWAGPRDLSRQMRQGQLPIEAVVSSEAKRLKLGFASDDFGYAISLGLPAPTRSQFQLDPEVKHESIWAGPVCRPAAVLVQREGPTVKRRDARQWQVAAQHVAEFDSLFDHVGSLDASPEVVHLRERIRGWRFYDHFRTDAQAPARQPRLGTRTPVLHADGRDLAAALQTIKEIGDFEGLQATIADAFAGTSVDIDAVPGGLFSLQVRQTGLLRPLSAAELSDGTLRFLLLTAALLTPRPPSMLVLNEPENSLHPDLLPALARLIRRAARHTQVWVVSHATRLVAALEEDEGCNPIHLEKVMGQTTLLGQGLLDAPMWRWPD